MSKRPPAGAALRLVRPASPELATFLTKVYARENARLAGGSPASLDDYKLQVRTLQKFFDRECRERGEAPRNLTIEDVDDGLLAGAMAWLKAEGRSARTCNKLRRTIRAIHAFALNEKGFPGKPLRIKKYKELKRRPQAWRPEQVGRLLEAARAMPGMVGCVPAGRWHYAHLMFLLNTGTRITAAMETPSAMLDLEQGWVTIPAEVQKHDQDEMFDLLPETVEALRAIQPHRHRRIFDDWPFDRTKRQWPALIKRLKKILVAAGLFPSVKEIPPRLELFHKLRRCFATFIAIKAGKGASRELCGHSDESVTDLYLDPTQMGERPRCRELLAGMLSPAKPDRQKKLFE
jgi:site-specific recombinase XerD